MQIIFSDKESARNERDRLLKEVVRWLETLERLHSRYAGRVRRLRKKIAELDRIIGE